MVEIAEVPEVPAEEIKQQPEWTKKQPVHHSRQLYQLVDKARGMPRTAVARLIKQQSIQFIEQSNALGLAQLFVLSKNLGYDIMVEWAAEVLLFVAHSRTDPVTAYTIFQLVEKRVYKDTPAWKVKRYNARINYVQTQETHLKEQLNKTTLDGLDGELVAEVKELDPGGVMYTMLEECVELGRDHYVHAALYLMRSFLNIKHKLWIESENPKEWVEGLSPNQFYLWMCDKYEDKMLEKLTELIGEWNKKGLLTENSVFSNSVVRTLIKGLMDKQLYTHAVMVSQKNAHLLRSNPVPFMLSQHRMYNMAGPIEQTETEAVAYLSSVVEKSATVKSGRLFLAAVEAAEKHSASDPEAVSYLCGVAISRARHRHQIALLLGLAAEHKLELSPTALLSASAYWFNHNVDTCLTLLKAFCQTPAPTEQANAAKSRKWKNESSAALINTVSRLNNQNKQWETPQRVGLIFDMINSLPEHALRAHFPEIIKLYRKVAHSVSQDYVGYTLDGPDFKILTELSLLTRLANHLRRHIGSEDKKLYYLRKRGAKGRELADAEFATRLLYQTRVKLARKLTALTKEVARRQLVVDIVLAQDICRVLSDGSIFSGTLHSWRTYMCTSGIVPADAYSGNARETFLFESPNVAEADCDFLLTGDIAEYERVHVPIFDKPSGSINTLVTLDSMILLMDELTRIGVDSVKGEVHTNQATLLNDIFCRATDMVELVRHPHFKYKYNQLVTEAYIRAAAHYSPPAGVAVFEKINLLTTDGATWSAVLSSCIDEDLDAVYKRACDRMLSNQINLHDVYIQRNINLQRWDEVASGIEKLFSYGKFPNQKTMTLILGNRDHIEISDLLLEASKEKVPVYDKATSLEILKELTTTATPKEAMQHYKNLNDALGLEGLAVIAESLSRVSPEEAQKLVPKFVNLLVLEAPIEYLTALMRFSPENIFEVAEGRRKKAQLLNVNVENIEAFTITALDCGIPATSVYNNFLLPLRTVVPPCISVNALKTVLLRMDPEEAKQEYRKFVEDISKHTINIDKLRVAKHLHHEQYGCDIKPYFDPARLHEIADKGDYLIPNIFDGLYNNKAIPCHSVFYNYATFDKNLTAEGEGVDVSSRFDGKKKEEYTKRYEEVFNCT